MRYVETAKRVGLEKELCALHRQINGLQHGTQAYLHALNNIADTRERLGRLINPGLYPGKRIY